MLVHQRVFPEIVEAAICKGKGVSWYAMMITGEPHFLDAVAVEVLIRRSPWCGIWWVWRSGDSESGSHKSEKGLLNWDVRQVTVDGGRCCQPGTKINPQKVFKTDEVVMFSSTMELVWLKAGWTESPWYPTFSPLYKAVRSGLSKFSWTK